MPRRAVQVRESETRDRKERKVIGHTNKFRDNRGPRQVSARPPILPKLDRRTDNRRDLLNVAVDARESHVVVIFDSFHPKMSRE